MGHEMWNDSTHSAQLYIFVFVTNNNRCVVYNGGCMVCMHAKARARMMGGWAMKYLVHS